MHMKLKGAAAALGIVALTGTASAQFGPPQEPWTNDQAVLTADLDIGNTGTFTGLLNPEMTRMCYILNAGPIEQPTAVRILSGAPGEGGEVVLQLKTPASGSSAACVDLQADVARAMVENPEGYRLAISNAAYPQGYISAPLVAQQATAAAG